MSNHTANLKLEKPLQEEFYDVDVQNGNMDILDAAIETIKEGYVKKAGDTMTGQLIAEGGVKGDLAGTADKAIADKNGNDIDETYLPLKGGEMTGSVNFNTVGGEISLKGNTSKLGFYYNDSVLGAYDWGNNKGIWSYNKDNQSLSFATLADFEAGIRIGQGSITMADSGETKIVGENSSVGISFNGNKNFDIYNWKKGISLLHWDGNNLEIGPVNEAGHSLYFRSTYQGDFHFVQHSNDPVVMEMYNDTGKLGYMQFSTGGQLAVVSGDGTIGTTLQRATYWTVGKRNISANVDDAGCVLQFWDNTANALAALHMRKLIVSDEASDGAGIRLGNTRLTGNNGQAGCLEIGSDDNVAEARIQWTTPDRSYGTFIRQIGSGVSKGQLVCSNNFQATSFRLADDTVVGAVSVLTGVIANGGTIPLPSGYTEAQCHWFVSPNKLQVDDDSWNYCYTSAVQYDNQATAGRVVTLFSDQRRGDANVRANYMIIGVK